MDNITQFPKKDTVADMFGPRLNGHSLIIDGHVVPNVIVRDNGDEVEFLLDHRMSWSFPRDLAWNAASLLAHAMAIGAGHPCLTAPHKDSLPYGTQVMCLDSLPSS